MKIGDCVTVLAFSQYRGKYKGETGTIERTANCNSVGVRLDEFKNSASSYGLFWFDKSALALIESEEQKMLEYPLLVNVSFVDNSNTPPSYYTYGAFDTNLQVGDLVVLNTGHHGMTVGNITKVFGENDNPVKVKYNREVIGKVDSSAYTEEKEKAKKRTEIKAKMDYRVKELQAVAIYEMLSEKDSELKALLDEYKDLDKSEDVEDD